MGEGNNYEGLRAQYREYKKRVIAAGNTSNVADLKLALEEIPKLEKELVDFCISNGHDLADLKKFFRDVDNEALPAGSLPG